MVLGIFLIYKGKEKQKEETKTGNFTGIVSGASIGLAGVILLLIVLVGGVILLVIYGGAKVAKSASADPDKAIDRTVRLSEAVKNVRK